MFSSVEGRSKKREREREREKEVKTKENKTKYCGRKEKKRTGGKKRNKASPARLSVGRNRETGKR